jgi:hypothetical protein
VRDHNDRAARVLDDVMADRPEYEARQVAMAVVSDDEKVCVLGKGHEHTLGDALPRLCGAIEIGP